MKYVILIHSNPQPWGHPTGQLRRRGARSAAGGSADAGGGQSFDGDGSRSTALEER